jgi:prolipoprotein diacylglyceryltransferase
MPGLVIAHAWGRLGCFMAGCCHGRPTASVLGSIRWADADRDVAPELERDLGVLLAKPGPRLAEEPREA